MLDVVVLVKGFVMSLMRNVDSWVAQKSDSANLAVERAFADGFVPSVGQVDSLVAQKSDSANLAVEQAFAGGFAPSVGQIDSLIAQNSHSAN